MHRTLLLALIVSLSAHADPLTGAQDLFNGTDLSGWTTVIDKLPVGEDPKRYVQVNEGTIHMYKDVADGETVPFGYIRTNKEYSSFQMTLEYRWLDRRFPPRADALRDAGLLYHLNGTDKVWPDCIECQIQEGDTGDLVLLKSKAFTTLHPKPDDAAQGLGTAGLLYENGGTPQFLGPGGYIGRFAEFDKLEGWNHVEIIVHANRYAEHVVNGKTVARISDIRTSKDSPLKAGYVGIQLEGAELQYRNITLKELSAPIESSHEVVSLSAVDGENSSQATVTITNSGTTPLPCAAILTGSDAEAFSISDIPETLALGESQKIIISFKRTAEPFRHSAGLQIGPKESGTFITLQGIGQKAFEGANEPPLQEIVHALGIPLNVGGNDLHLPTKPATIGDSIVASRFKSIENKPMIITPLARYSPKGSAPFGIIINGEQQVLGKLADSSSDRPDAHQCLFPPLENGESSVMLTATDQPFSLFFEGHKQLSCTDPNVPTNAKIKHTARIYPISHYQGKPIPNSYIVGFEEASNGDYQDALFLIQNVKAVTEGN